MLSFEVLLSEMALNQLVSALDVPSVEELRLQTVVRRPVGAGPSMSRGAVDRSEGGMGGLAGPTVSRGAMGGAWVGIWDVSQSSATRPDAPHIILGK